MSTYRVVLADDHLLFREGMKRLVEEIPGVEVIGEASDGVELLDLLRRLSPDLAILDISMPNLRGIEAAQEIKMAYPHIKILILTMHKSKEYLYHAIAAGAQGYLLKEDSDLELFSALETIRNGGTYITRLLAGELAKDLSQVYSGKAHVLRDPLTTREKEVLKLIAEGKSNTEIANLFFISVRTVEHHRANLLEKLNAKKTADLVRHAVEKGLI